MSAVTSTGRAPLRLGGAVSRLLLGEHTDAFAAYRPWCRDRDVTEPMLVALERLIDRVAPEPGETRDGFAVAVVLLAAAVEQGSSALAVGAAPGFDGLRDALTAPDAPPVERSVDELVHGFAAALARDAEQPETARVVGSAGTDRPLCLDRDALYLQYVHVAEVAVARRLRALLDAGDAASWKQDDIAAAAATTLGDAPLRWNGQPLRLAAGQLRAVLQAPSSSLLVLSGGPGTGKTSVVTSILRVFASLGVDPADILLASPTGRAANRLGETVSENLASIEAPIPSDEAFLAGLSPGRTLHRLLGYSQFKQTFKYGPDVPLHGRVLVVDEVSMVDLPLMAALLDAIPDPSNRPFTLVLVGDAEQLPAVGTGDVLGQLTSQTPAITDELATKLEEMGRVVAEKVPPEAAHEQLPAHLEALERDEDDPLRLAYVRLDHTFRQAPDQAGREIQALARHMNAGDADAVWSGEFAMSAREAPGDVAFSGAELLAVDARDAAYRTFFERYAAEHLVAGELAERLEEGFEPDDPDLAALLRWSVRSRVLCFTHRGANGEEYINGLLNHAVDKKRGWDSFAYPGCPVLVLENDYGTGLFNGDQGVVAPVRTTDGSTRLDALFPGGDGVKRVPIGRLPRAKLCFAMTVHKSQGSEFDHVVLVLPEKENRLLARETVYTAVTRARRSVTVIGTRETMELAAKKQSVRVSFVRSRVAGDG